MPTAIVTNSTPDAGLISLCKCLVLNEAASNAITASPDYEDDERPPRPRLESLADEMRTMPTGVAQLPLAVTLEGLRAMSQAALALASKDDDGAVDFGVDSVEHLAFTVIRAMAGWRYADWSILPIRAGGAAAGSVLCAVPMGLRVDRHDAGRGTAPTSVIQTNGRRLARGRPFCCFIGRRHVIIG
jgi:hypothetical protein